MKTKPYSMLTGFCATAMLALVAGMATPLSADGTPESRWLELPSGMSAELIEIIWDEDDRIGRFRFVAPALSDDGTDDEAVSADMHALCREFALPVQRGLRPGWEAIVIALAEAPLPFGEYDPAVLQLFGGFTAEGADCHWDDF
ncbi:MAG: acetolactate synthase [Pararhodobacter sp.]|nr:acetolactate synthase [Pararhodobacter sp.]